MTPMHRRSSALLLAVVAIAASACGGSDNDVGTDSTTTTPPTAASTSLPATTTATTIPVSPSSIAVWPVDSSATRYDSPVAAARGFATDYARFVNPIVGAFQPGDARSGEVPVRARAAGPVTTVIVRQIGSDDSWWVLGSSTPNINIARPAAGASVSSPVRLQGTSTAFEATVNYKLLQDTGGTLADGFVMGGANGEMGPFTASVAFANPTSAYGSLMLYTTSSESGNVDEASVIGLRFSAAP